MFPEYGFLDLIAHYCLYRKKTLPHLMLGLRYDRHRMIHRQSEKKSRRAIISERLEGLKIWRGPVKFGFSEKATKFEKNPRRTFDESVVFCARNSILVKKSSKIFFLNVDKSYYTGCVICIWTTLGGCLEVSG